MEQDSSIYSRLGYGVLDFSVGDWLLSDDVFGRSSLVYGQQDDKACVRELLRVLGKRFPTAEAGLIWHEIEDYRTRLARTFGPPGKEIGLPAFEWAAHEWYRAYGVSFQKRWHLRASIELHYARNADERCRGRWIRWVHPHLLHFVEAGFSPGEVLTALRLYARARKRGMLNLLRHSDEAELTHLWIAVTAWLMEFDLDESRLAQARLEIAEHTAWLTQQGGRAVEAVEAALDYFRRLQQAGLGAEAIG